MPRIAAEWPRRYTRDKDQVFMFRVLLAASMLASSLAAQDDHLPPRSATAALADALSRALSPPPEAGADYLLHIGTRLSMAPEQRIELTHQILELARRSDYAVPLDFTGGISADSLASRTVEAAGQGLDRATLSGRALILLGAASPQLTRDTLDDLLRIRMPDTDCGTCYSPDPRVIYTTIARELPHAYSKTERDAERHLELLQRAVLSVHSPSQIHGVAALLTTVALSAPQRELLVGLFGGMLRNLPRNDRAFARAMSSGTVFNAMLAVIDAASAPVGLASQWRDFIEQAAPLNVCRDFWSGSIPQRIAEGFRRSFEENRSSLEVRPLTVWTKPSDLIPCRSGAFAAAGPDGLRRDLGDLAPLLGETSITELERDALVRLFDTTTAKLRGTGCEGAADAKACLHHLVANLAFSISLPTTTGAG